MTKHSDFMVLTALKFYTSKSELPHFFDTSKGKTSFIRSEAACTQQASQRPVSLNPKLCSTYVLPEIRGFLYFRDHQATNTSPPVPESCLSSHPSPSAGSSKQLPAVPGSCLTGWAGKSTNSYRPGRERRQPHKHCAW